MPVERIAASWLSDEKVSPVGSMPDASMVVALVAEYFVR